MRGASVTETSRSGGQYIDYEDGGDGDPVVPPVPPRPDPKLPPSQKTLHFTPPSRLSTPVPVHPTLPTTVPSDLIPPSATWVNSSVYPSTLIHPSTWIEVSSQGPYPFTTLITYRLPVSNTEITWEARHHRRQIEQSCVANIPPSIQAKRDQLESPWYHRIHQIHLKRWSWWAVLWFNVGSHALLYAAVCLFIPYFNDNGSGIYEANTGWSSNVLAAIFWLAGSLFEIIALMTAKPAGKWYQVPRPLLPKNQRKVDPSVYQCAHVDDPRSTFSGRGTGISMDWLLLSTRFVAYLAFLCATVAYSGAFNLTEGQRIGTVSVAGIIASALLVVTSYLALAECCHQWLPVKRSIHSSLTFLDWWINVMSLVASLALLAYYIDLTVQPDLLDQRQGPAYPYIVMAFFFTASDWVQAVEQGERFFYEKAQSTSDGGVAANGRIGAAPLIVQDESGDNEVRLSIQSPRGVRTTA